MSDRDKRSHKQRYARFEWGRKFSQLLFLGVFFFLFLKTDYTGSDSIEYAVNIFFRLDPLLAITTMVAAKAFISLMIPALFVLLASLVVGRSFCGWFCPLGSMLDIFQKMIRGKQPPKATFFPRLPLIVFLFVFFSSVFGASFAGYIDPFSLLFCLCASYDLV